MTRLRPEVQEVIVSVKTVPNSRDELISLTARFENIKRKAGTRSSYGH